MGGKHFRTRKRLLFLVAGLILSIFSGCATMAKSWEELNQQSASPEGKPVPSDVGAATSALKKDDLARIYLRNGKKFLIEGDYQGSLREFQKVVALLGKASPADEAVFYTGMVYVYWGNPKKDYGQAMTFLKRVVKEYPKSPFLLQADTWVGILLARETLVGENEKLIKAAAKLEKDNERLARENEKWIKEHEKWIRENEKLTKMLEEYKQVDIDIEGKKREKGR